MRTAHLAVLLRIMSCFCTTSSLVSTSILRSSPHASNSHAVDLKYEQVESYIRHRTLRELLPPEDLAHAWSEFIEDSELWHSCRPTYDEYTKRIENQLRSESRSLGDLLGPIAQAKLLSSIEDLTGDADATRTFLRTPAVESVIGDVLYEGIFEFIQTVDLIGNIVSNLPVIGPVRQQIVTSFKRDLDRTLGRQVKRFLGSYSRLATEQLASMVLSEENSKGFASARRTLGEELLRRPLSSMVPSQAVVQKLRDGAWKVAQEPPPLGTEEIVDRVYTHFGDDSIDKLGFSTPPQFQVLARTALQRFLESEEGRRFMNEGA